MPCLWRCLAPDHWIHRKKRYSEKNQLRVSGKMTEFVTDAAVVGTRQRTTDRIQIDRIIIISRIQTDRTVPKN